MSVAIILVSSMLCSIVSSQRFPKSVQIEGEPTYLTNVIHTLGGNSDNWAESSLNPNNQDRSANRLVQSMPPSKSDLIYAYAPLNAIYDYKLARRRSDPDINTFNVGYNIRFSQHSEPYKQPKLATRQNKFENAEIITGKVKRNEKVRAPNSHGFPKEQPLKKLVQYQQHEHQFPTNYRQEPSRIQVIQTHYQPSPHWRNIGTNMEMTRSLEGSPIQESIFQTNYLPNQANQNRFPQVRVPLENSFNHAQAMRNSQPFDLSNANGEISDNIPQGSTHYNENTKFSIPDQTNVEAVIPAHLKGVKPLPLDTSLLKEPVLMTDVQNVGKNSRILPIHFDLRPIQAALQEQRQVTHYRHHSNF